MAELNEKFVFIFFDIYKFQHLCIICVKSGHLNNIPNFLFLKIIILTLDSKHFGHVTSCLADVESG